MKCGSALRVDNLWNLLMNPTWSVCLSMWALSRILIRRVSKGQSAFCLQFWLNSDFHIVPKAHPIIFFLDESFPTKKRNIEWNNRYPRLFCVFCFEPHPSNLGRISQLGGWVSDLNWKKQLKNWNNVPVDGWKPTRPYILLGVKTE